VSHEPRHTGGEPTRMGHEYCGYVEELGEGVASVKAGQFVVGSFAASDNTCPACRIGYQSSCVHREFISQAQSPYLRVPHADGTLVATREARDASMVPALLASSDVLGTGWYAAADAAKVEAGATAVVVGDGAVGLLATLSAKQMGAERIIVMSRNPARQKLARNFGATDIIAERGEDGVAKILEITRGFGADSVLECVGTSESMQQAMRVTRKGGHMPFVGVPHGVEIEGQPLFFSDIHLEGGPAPVRRYLPNLIDLVLSQKIDPSPVFDLVLPLEQVANGYKAMDQRRAIKALLQP